MHFECERIEALSRSSDDDQTLVVFFYRGHGVIKQQGLIHGISEFDDSQNLEEFTRRMAKIDRVFVLSLFDCCRLDETQ